MNESLQELLSLTREKAVRRLALVVSSRNVRLNAVQETNKIYILELKQGDAAGGREGGLVKETLQEYLAFLMTMDHGKKCRNP
mgnify:CR=1 FL=1